MKERLTRIGFWAILGILLFGGWAMNFGEPSLQIGGILVFLGAVLLPAGAFLLAKLSRGFAVIARHIPVLVLGLVYWFAITLVYTYLLHVSSQFQSLSVVYHGFLLLLPAMLLTSRVEEWKDLGFVFNRDTLRLQAFWIAFVLLVPLLGTYGRAIVLGRPVNIQVSVPWSFFVFSVALVPLAEETLWRGTLQPKLEAALTKNGGLVIAALLYALMHVPKILLADRWYLSPSYLPSIVVQYPAILLIEFFALGILLGRAYQETKSVYTPIAMHVLFNAVIFIFIIAP